LVIDVVIPALNEEDSIPLVLNEIPSWVREIVVCDNGSSDRTAQVAQQAGATVVHQPTKGYGLACLTALDYIRKKTVSPEAIVFLDADYSDYPAQMERHLTELTSGFDLVIGSRKLGNKEKGSMTFPQRFGNWLSSVLLRILYGAKFTDLGPFRAIKWQALESLGMEDQNFGWTVEMQIKAMKKGLRYTEVPVDYKRRVGVSKVSGTLKGAISAGYKIIYTLFKYV